MSRDAKVSVSMSQGRRIAKAVQYFEAHGRNHVGPVGDPHRRTTLANLDGDESFGVLVKANGTDGDGYPTYDVFALTDTGLTMPLNASPLSGSLTRWRGATGLSVTAAADGTYGEVFYDGTQLVLTVAKETVCSSSQTWGTNSL